MGIPHKRENKHVRINNEMSGHLSFQLNYKKYLIDKREKAYFALHEYTLKCMTNPGLLTCDKVTSLLSKLKEAVNKEELYGTSDGERKARSGDHHQITVILLNINGFFWCYPLTTERFFQLIMNLHAPDSPFRAELEAQYDERVYVTTKDDAFFKEN